MPRIQRHLDLHPEPQTIHRAPLETAEHGESSQTIFRAKQPRDPTTPREDKREVPPSVETRGGVEIEVKAGALDHILEAHTVENFDPVARLPEIQAGVMTSLFPPGFATNAQEIVTLVKQALGNKAAKKFDPRKDRSVEVKVRNVKIQEWAGPIGKSKPGAYRRRSSTLLCRRQSVRRRHHQKDKDVATGQV